jgi:3-oxoacyl-[acyl-carrier-protein] synthase-3
MGLEAAKMAMASAGISKEDLGMIIVATSSPEQISPATACVIHNKLGIRKNVPAFDINAVCSGFLYAVSLAATMVSHGTYDHVLVIATEAYSKITDWHDKHCVFFGDGAGAVVVSRSETGWMSFLLEANGSGTGMTGFKLPLNSVFTMRGKEVWDQAVKVIPDSIRQVMAQCDIGIDDISLIIPHQPSIHILKQVAEQLNCPFSKVKTVMDRYANIAGASIPIALDEAVRQQQVRRGDLIVLSAIGSGWTWGSMVVRYEGATC